MKRNKRAKKLCFEKRENSCLQYFNTLPLIDILLYTTHNTLLLLDHKKSVCFFSFASCLMFILEDRVKNIVPYHCWIRRHRVKMSLKLQVSSKTAGIFGRQSVAAKLQRFGIGLFCFLFNFHFHFDGMTSEPTWCWDNVKDCHFKTILIHGFYVIFSSPTWNIHLA